jgi:hypothetical protein
MEFELKRWPTLDDKAFYGVAGRFVQKVSPLTEADPAAILGQLLVATGNIIGPKPLLRIQ